MTHRLCAWLLPLLCIGFGVVASLPLWLTPGLPNSDDSLTHTFNLFALDQGVQAGNPFPLRFPDHGLGYGYAVLAYYPPLPYALLEAIQLCLADYVLTFKVGFMLITVLAGLTSFWFGKTVFDEWAGLLAAFLYLFHPYFQANLHVRGALAEHLGLAIGPLVFLAIFHAVQQPGWRTYLCASLTVALMILTHFLSTLLYLPFALLYVGWLLMHAPVTTRWRSLGRLVAATITGLGIVCFYWLPALLEREGLKQIDSATALAEYLAELAPLTDLLRTTLLVHYTNIHNMPNLGLSVIGLLLVACCVMVARRRCLSNERWSQWLFFSLAGLLALLFGTVYATPLWRSLPAIALIQFPFRWLGPAAFFMAVLVGGMASARVGLTIRSVRTGAVLLTLVSLWYGYASLRNLPVAPTLLRSLGVAQVENQHITLAGLRAFEHDRADSLRDRCWVWAYEYIPRSSSLSDCATMRDTLLQDLPIASDLPPVSATVQPISATPNTLQAYVSSPISWTLSLHAFWIPGWRASIDGVAAPTEPVAPIGMAGLRIPAGDHTIYLEYELTPLRRAMVILSVTVLLAWFGVALRYQPWLGGTVAIALALLIGATTLTARQAIPSPQLHTVDVEFGGQVALQGYAMAVEEGHLRLDLIWLTRQPLPASYKVFVHVIDDTGKLWTQDDSRPVHYASNTNRWLPGQVILDQHMLALPADMPSGRYQVRVGLYREEDGGRLHVLNERGAVIDDQALLNYAELNR